VIELHDKKIMKVGNSYAISIKPSFIKEGSLSADKKYKVTIEEEVKA
jgi:hypothetical protein